MALALVMAVAPTTEPVSLAEAKLQARVDVATDDALITALITAARELVEKTTWRALITQRWDFYLDAWPEGDEIVLPKPPLKSVVTLEYTSEAGATVAVPAADYAVDVATEPGRIVLKSGAAWPGGTLARLNPIHVRFECGYGAAAAVPEAYKLAIKLLVASWYENREAVTFGSAAAQELPWAVRALLNVDHARRQGGYF